VPAIFFTHDNYLKDYTRHGPSKEIYFHKPTILLVRHPADVAVSQYFQWKHRMRRRKKRINKYPLDSSLSLYEFVVRPDCGLPKIIGFMNDWAKDLPLVASALVVRYEDMRAETAATLGRILQFIGTPGEPHLLLQAAEAASVENMRKLEDRGTFLLRRGPLIGKDRNNPNRYKARRAKVGGYRDDFTESQIAEIDSLIESQLSAVFGYAKLPPVSRLAGA
jgi:hypothetical protein